MVENYTESEHFQEFSDSPKECTIQNIQGSIRYLSNVLKTSEQGPKCSTLIHIFNQFTVEEIKDYVYRRMTKKILLELALCILEEIASGGIARAKTIVIVLKRTASGGKQIEIQSAPSDDEEFPLSNDDESIIRDLDEAEFDITDSSGASPARTIRSGKHLAPPFSQKDLDAFSTPKKSSSKSLSTEFDRVRNAYNNAWYICLPANLQLIQTVRTVAKNSWGLSIKMADSTAGLEQTLLNIWTKCE